MDLVVKSPVSAHLMIPDAKKESMLIDLENRTNESLPLSAILTLAKSWKSTGKLHQQVTLAPFEQKRLAVPITLAGYSNDNQLYPVHLQMESGKYREEIVHDFYVGVAHYAHTPPSLDGTWKGWNQTNPMLINKASQIGRLLFGNQPWGGEKDLSAKIYAMYDQQYLYIGAAVMDDSLVPHWDFPRMSYPWDTDCMEVVLDTRVNATQGHDPPTPGLFRHLSLAEYRETNFSAEAWQGAGAGAIVLPLPRKGLSCRGSNV